MYIHRQIDSIICNMYSDNESDDSRPVTPSEEDCCHNACDPCIYDVHRMLLDEYEKKKRQRIRTTIRKNLLCLSSYKSFVINNLKEISGSYILLSLRYQGEARKDANIVIDPGQYIMLHLGDRTRPYTPISWTKRDIDCLIKLYPDGKFSTNLKKAKVGDRVDVRGPYGDFQYKCNSFQQIIMFCIGSGIAATYPIAKAIVDNEFEETRVYLISGFKNMLEVPLKKELQNLSSYWNFKCTLYLSQPLDDNTNLHGIDTKTGRITKESVLKILKDHVPDTSLVIICGTNKFNTSVEEWTRDMNYANIHVFK